MWVAVSVTISHRLVFPCVFVNSLAHVHVNFSYSHSPPPLLFPSRLPFKPPVLQSSGRHPEAQILRLEWCARLEGQTTSKPSGLQILLLLSWATFPQLVSVHSALPALSRIPVLWPESLLGHMIYSVHTFWCSGILMSSCKLCSEASLASHPSGSNHWEKMVCTLYSPLRSPWCSAAFWSPRFLWDWFVPHLLNMSETRTKMANI